MKYNKKLTKMFIGFWKWYYSEITSTFGESAILVQVFFTDVYVDWL